MALQFDNAVSLVGTAIENASQEQVKVGSEDKPEWRQKYTMSQLLDPDFRLPLRDNRQEKETDENTFFGGLIGFPLSEVS